MLHKKLETGTIVGAWNYDEGNTQGEAIGVKNKNGNLKSIFNIESVRCLEGVVNRVVLKKAELEALGFIVLIDDQRR